MLMVKRSVNITETEKQELGAKGFKVISLHIIIIKKFVVVLFAFTDLLRSKTFLFTYFFPT